MRSLGGDLSKTRFADLEQDPDAQTEFATGVGRQLVLGGNLLEARPRPPLLARQRQLPRPRRRDRRPRPAAGHGAGPALDRGAARIGAAGRGHRDPDRRGRGRGDATPNPPRSPSSDPTTWRASTTSTRAPASWRRCWRCSAPRGASGSRGRPTNCSPTCSLPARSDLGRVPGRDRGRPLRRPGRASAACATPASPARTTAARRSPSRSARSSPPRRWSPWRRSPSSTTAATSTSSSRDCASGCPTCSASPSSASSTTRSGAGEATDTPRGWRGHARALRQGSLSTGAIKALGALALAAYVVSGRGLESWRYIADVALLILATNAFNLFDMRPGRAEKALVLLGAGLCLGGWTIAPAGAARDLRRPGPGRRLVHPARAGDARRHRLEPGRRDRRRLAADLSRRRRAPDRARARRRD